MKLITRDADNLYLNKLRDLLEERGITSFVSGENTARVIPFFYMSQAGLWVYLDNQILDAQQLIIDNDHIVTTGIDVKEFYESQPVDNEQASQLNSGLMHLGLFVVAIIAGLFLLSWILSLV